jgi:hypothetical protein
MKQRWKVIACALLLAVTGASSAVAGSAKIIKVLPHYLDAKGRHMVNPSLFDRDAYQLELRNAPEKRKALRFDVHLRATGDDDALTLRVDVRSMHQRTPKMQSFESAIRPRWRSRWSSVLISGDEYKNLGDLVAWRAVIVSGTNVLAEQKSFLW